MSQYKNGIVVGRFQPFHNGHLRYVLKALDQSLHLYIGITTPGNVATEFEPRDENRLGEKNNPFTFAERKQMIELALKDRQVKPERHTILHFDPTDVAAWFAQVPEDAVYFLILTRPEENKKVEEMQSRGLTVVVLDELSDRDFVGNDIRANMLANQPWEKSLSPSVAEYLKEIDAITRIKKLHEKT